MRNIGVDRNREEIAATIDSSANGLSLVDFPTLDAKRPRKKLRFMHRYRQQCPDVSGKEVDGNATTTGSVSIGFRCYLKCSSALWFAGRPTTVELERSESQTF